MNFSYIEFLPLVLFFFCVFAFFFYRFDLKSKRWIESNWNLEKTKRNKYSVYFLLASIFLFLLALLDLRGPTEYIQTDIPDQRTVILIDQSASMLAEDIRPSRYERSIMVARHFVRNAVGHRIAIVVFSDNQKRVVPFTSDIEFLDSRLNALRSIDIRSGGTNLTQAMRESLQYFKTGGRGSESEAEVFGNLLVFTDAEDHGERLEFDVPDGISIAMVGVGTRSGARIPIRDRNGNFRNYKRHMGEEIITKLDEEYLVRLASLARRNSYWILRSGTMPTDEIVDFFREGHRENVSRGSVRIRPVLVEYLMIPAIVLFVISVFLGRGEGLKRKRDVIVRSVLILFALNYFSPNVASADVSRKLERLQRGELSYAERLMLAEELARQGMTEEARTLYDENFDLDRMPPESLLNYGTTLIEDGDLINGVRILDHIIRDDNISDDVKSAARRNILRAIALQEQEQQEEQQQDQDDDRETDPDGDEGEEGDQMEGDQDDESSEGDQQRDGEPGDQQQEPGDPDFDDDSDQETDPGEEEDDEDADAGQEDEEEGPDESPSQTIEEREEELRRQRQLTDIPGVVEQILDRDRDFQERFLNSTSTNEPAGRDRKDW